MARTELPHGIILPAEYSDDWYDDMTSNLSKLDEVIGSDAEKLSEEDVGAAALSNDYTDLDNKPSIPTKTSDLTNDSNFVDNTDPAVASGITSAKVTSYDSHVADTDIHVTTADKQKWNNGVSQAYVLRYASTSVTPSSTISYSVLNNTDNIKAGDSVIDSAGQVFLIASVDSANQTVTVSAVLLTLALDANVMHLSGNESASGNKNFTDNISAKKIISNVAQLQINARSSGDSVAIIAGADASEGGGIYIYGKDSSDKSRVGLQVYDTDTSTFHAARLNMDGSFTPTVSNNGLGSQSFKWVGFNGLNPGALSLPDFSNAIDISGYITVTGGSTIENLYTPLTDGYISVNLGRSSGAIGLIISNGKIEACVRENTFPDNHRECGGFIPVQKNDNVVIISCLADSIIWAYFIPCQGNV